MPTNDRPERIAIVGVGGIFPGAPSLETFWTNIAGAVDSGRHAPPGRWFLSPEKAFGADGPLTDRVYSTWGCFVENFQFDPTGLNLDSALVDRLDPLFHLGLHSARAAFENARRLAQTDLNRVGVILGNIALPTESTSALCRDVLGRTFVEGMRKAASQTDAVRSQLDASLIANSPRLGWHPLNRFAASLPAALIAQGLNFGGLAYTLDAACASSLYALKFACEELRAHRADAMVTGGMSRPDCQYTQMGFAQLKALSRQGRCAPLSAAADGLVVGEGAGVFVLKRLRDAIAANDQIYGVIAGIGLSNDRGANLLAPHSEGQLRAMRLAYDEAGWRPSDIDLIECHATGTPVGDSVEIASLRELWRDEAWLPGQCVIGGVKSNIGHLLTGAGAAGLMKVLFALKNQTLPPTANYTIPAAALEDTSCPFRVLEKAEPWRRRGEAAGGTFGGAAPAMIPRRATVNAFGFGGINAHVLIEEYCGGPLRNDGGPSQKPIRLGANPPRPLSETELTPKNQGLDIAVVGLAIRVGSSGSKREGSQQFNAERRAQSASSNDWGVTKSEWYASQFGSRVDTHDYTLDAISEVRLPLGEFRIPPVEMQDMLPQQQLMLAVAAEALRDSTGSQPRPAGDGAGSSGEEKSPHPVFVPARRGLSARLPAHRDEDTRRGSQIATAPGTTSHAFELPIELGNRTGVFIGIELDPNTTNFHLRWSVEELAPRWAETLGLEMSSSELSQWIENLKDSISPPLTANRVMGNLGGIVASRLAREFNAGGPSFTISSDQNSGLRACEVAAQALRRGELDRALVGAVDLPCDIRSQVADLRAELPGTRPSNSDGATAIVLKRLEDALRDGDHIHAVIRNIDTNNVGWDQSSQSHQKKPWWDCARSELVPPCANIGAATGLVNLATQVASLSEKSLVEPSPHHWLRNRCDGPRRINVHGSGFDGNNLVFELTEPAGDENQCMAPTDDSQNHFKRRLRLESLPAHLFVIDGDSDEEIESGLRQIASLVPSQTSLPRFSRAWYRTWPPHTNRVMALVLVMKNLEEAPEIIRAAFVHLNADANATDLDRRVKFSRVPVGSGGRLAYVFPGSGNAFLGMGRELLASFPEVLLRQDEENQRLRDQYRPDLVWHGESTAAIFDDHKAMIFSQVAMGTAVCDLLELFEVRPSASLGYSLGESAAFFGLRAWTDRDEMLRRMHDATLFGSDLVRPFNAARREWNVSNDVEVDWVSGVIDQSATDVREALSIPRLPQTGRSEPGLPTVAQPVEQSRYPRVYLLIVNTPTQCVIGGLRDQVESLVWDLNAKFVPFTAPSTVHCEILRQVEPAYRALHLMQTPPPIGSGAEKEESPHPDPVFVPARRGLPARLPARRDEDTRRGGRTIDFYSAAWGCAYELSRESAAEAIVAQAVSTIDFPRVVEQAYADSVRVFVEIGPGSSCTRMIDEILEDRPHVAQSATPATANPVGAFLELLAVLIAERVSVDLGYLYGGPDDDSEPTDQSDREVVTRTGGSPFRIPIPRGGWPTPTDTVDRSANIVGRLIGDDAISSPLAVCLHPGAPGALRGDPGAPGRRRGRGEGILPFPTTLRLHHAQTDACGGRGEGIFSFPSPSSAFGGPTSITATATAPFQNDASPSSTSREPNQMAQLEEMLSARLNAHAAYLRFSVEAQHVVAEQIELLQHVATNNSVAPMQSDLPPSSAVPARLPLNRLPPSPTLSPPRSLSREQCMEFAVGRIGNVLGSMFAEIDRHPTRVRLPDDPLMLVDRILEIEGKPLSMTSGRVVTEHDIHPAAWYLDCERIPTCIAVEAGQADLFLSSWLGIDFETKGLASYRLLDAVVTFHDQLPRPGKVIHYDIRINNFFRQGQTYLFRFEFDSTVDGKPLLTMREGCAGFFTEAELAGGKGIVHTALDRKPSPGKRPSDWSDLVPMTVESYDDAKLLALRRGELEACFGPAFGRLRMANPMTLPGLTDEIRQSRASRLRASTDAQSVASGQSRMWLIDRVLKLDPSGGKFGIGLILGELDIHPDDWFLTCHFCDDQVMPGTLMYECCLHTLRIYLLRLGWIGEQGQVVYEPVPGIRSRLKCRGQVRANTRKVWYEITLKEIGYSRPSDDGGANDQPNQQPAESPYCLADALMYADGKPIVEITDMSVQLTGLTRSQLEQLWANRPTDDGTRRTVSPTASHSAIAPQSLLPETRYDRRPAIFNTDRITAFAIGNPSDAFGDRYRIFDSERIIARLPGPPFQFLDRIVAIEGCEPWALKAGGQVVAQYDVPPDAWYFASNRQTRMPYAVLLETALQPCGWLAAYVGSALTGEIDLSFRNLGGTATQYREITPESGTLTTTVKMKRVSHSGGMIIQHYDFDLRCQGEPVYVGNTYFGFFSKASLANQIGIRDAKPFVPSAADITRASRFRYIDAAPFADSRFQMIDDVQLSLRDGPAGYGFAIGTTSVDPNAWFFKAHFHQDPVVPGSLGLESFDQLLKFYAADRWQLDANAQFATPIVHARNPSFKPKHEWVYRGQVIPRDHLVTVSAVISQVDDSTRELVADGFLSVDGRVIYQMKEFSLAVCET